jgi:hypothetical protein
MIIMPASGEGKNVRNRHMICVIKKKMTIEIIHPFSTKRTDVF